MKETKIDVRRKQLRIERASIEQWREVVSWQLSEGWELGIGDDASYFSIDPTGFYVGYVDSVAVSAISVVAFQPPYAHVGHYLVKREFRGKGFGLEMWRRVMEMHKSASSSLYAVGNQRANYSKWGFRSLYDVVRMRGRFSSALPQSAQEAHSSLGEPDLDQIIELDRRCVGYRRDALLRSWFDGEGRGGLVYRSDGVLTAVLGFRSSTTGIRVGPAYSMGGPSLLAMLGDLVGHYPGHTQFSLDIPEYASDEIAELKAAGLQPEFSTTRMERGDFPSEDISAIKAVASLDVG